MRSTPERIRSTHPVSSAATARAYDWASEPELATPEVRPTADGTGQSLLFTADDMRARGSLDFQDGQARVIPFDTLTSTQERRMIRARALGIARPSPVPATAVEEKRPRRKRNSIPDQQQGFVFDEEGWAQTAAPQPNISCDIEVASLAMRMQATALDLLLMALPLLCAAFLYWMVGGVFAVERHQLPYLVAGALTIPVFYKLLWTIAGADTPGMRSAGIVLVNFDGNPPSSVRRYLRFFGGFISVCAAGLGLLWALVDEDRLTWHDHISSTFPAALE